MAIENTVLVIFDPCRLVFNRGLPGVMMQHLISSGSSLFVTVYIYSLSIKELKKLIV